MNFYAFLDKKVSNKTSNVLIDRERTVSWAELSQEVVELSRSIPPRSLVLNIADNSIGFIVGYLSFLKSMAVQYLLESNRLESMSGVCNRFSPDFIWITKQLLVNDEHYSYLSSDYTTIFEMTDRALLKRKRGKEIGVQSSKVCLLLPTSGTTGDPKCVRITHSNLEANTDSIVHALGMDESVRTITTLSPAYSFGLSVINTTLACQGTLILNEERIVTREFWDFALETRPTLLAGTPFIFTMLKKFHKQLFELTSLRSLIQAGGRLGEADVSYFHQRSVQSGVKFYVMYGQTEATARMTVLQPQDLPTRLGSVGLPVPQGEIEVQIEDGDRFLETPDMRSHVGEIIYTGPNVVLGYASSRSEVVDSDDFLSKLSTGDIGYKDDDGFLYIVGRVKRIVKIHDRRVNLDFLERELNNLLGYPIFVSGDDKGLILITENEVDAASIRRSVQSIAGFSNIPLRLLSNTVVPRFASGKVNYGYFHSL
jgi:acyl-CoA synthetase (AMP-forming)/AMP-acid ligase II